MCFNKSMRLPALLGAMVLALMLGACGTLAPSISAPIELPVIPTSLTRCERPSALPTAALSVADVERYWARDRVALVKCGANIAALDRFYDGLRAHLVGGKQEAGDER